ncbi:hypothetical protein QQ045_002517 [Rhodiola kirilowii]
MGQNIRMSISKITSKQAQTALNVPSGGSLTRNRSNITIRQKDKVVFVIGPTGTEIINSDKIQLYKGLDVVTNKITEEEKCGVRHHLLGITDPDSEFTARDYCEEASAAIESIVRTGQLPIIVGGSNSYMEALVDDKNNYFKTRNGMVDEVRDVFDPNASYNRGIRKAIEKKPTWMTRGEKNFYRKQ